MEVILLERIEKLGQMGDVVKVKPGFARNYLLPRRKALRATEANKAQFEAQKAQLEAANLERRSEAESVSKKMEGLSVVMVRQAGESGQLYGSVNTRDLAQAITEAGFTVERTQVRLERPIKSIGLFDVLVALHPEVSLPVTVNVARSQEEATIQAETGRALIAAEEERREQEAEDASRRAAEEAAQAAAAAAEAEGEAGDEEPAAEAGAEAEGTDTED